MNKITDNNGILGSKYDYIKKAPCISNETSCGDINIINYTSRNIINIIELVLLEFRKQKNEYIIKQVSQFISTFIDIISCLETELNIDINKIPPLFSTSLEDGSLLIEWLIYNYRIGYIFDENPEESVWYSFLKDRNRDSTTIGKLADEDLKVLLRKHILFVSTNT